ncbi:class I SAM-dependent methyltransferase [Nocardioides korecus]
MSRYTYSAPWYDALSAEPIYGVGRTHAIPALGLQEGSRVLDVGCGTGLNFPLLLEAVGKSGQVVGVDRSPEMLEVARRKAVRRPPGNVVLVEADAERLDRLAISGPGGSAVFFDAVLFTYSLSLMKDWRGAWNRASSLVRTGGRAAIVDMEPPHRWARIFDPAARLACSMGGADIHARPWTALEATATDVQTWSLRGGHVQVRVGTL